MEKDKRISELSAGERNMLLKYIDAFKSAIKKLEDASKMGYNINACELTLQEKAAINMFRQYEGCAEVIRELVNSNSEENRSYRR